MSRRGVVLERDGAQYRVLLADGAEVRAVLRGKLKRKTPQVVVGDRLQLEDAAQGELYGIAAVEPRRSVVERRVPLGRGARPVVANVDRVIVVTASTDPVPIPSLIDRLLVVAEVNDLPAVLVVNKTDLDDGAALVRRYVDAGYPVVATSVRTGAGIERISALLAHGVSVVTGPSGAGKSSLLNTIGTGFSLRTGAISEKGRRGRQTTVGAVMVPFGADAFLVDTPGFSEVGLWGVEPRELAACFPEFRPLLGHCRFQDCRHVSEPGCRIAAAAEAGAIHPDRLASYRLLLSETEAEPADWE